MNNSKDEINLKDDSLTEAEIELILNKIRKGSVYDALRMLSKTELVLLFDGIKSGKIIVNKNMFDKARATTNSNSVDDYLKKHSELYKNS